MVTPAYSRGVYLNAGGGGTPRAVADSLPVFGAHHNLFFDNQDDSVMQSTHGAEASSLSGDPLFTSAANADFSCRPSRCGCRVPSRGGSGGGWVALLALLGAFGMRRRAGLRSGVLALVSFGAVTSLTGCSGDSGEGGSGAQAGAGAQSSGGTGAQSSGGTGAGATSGGSGGGGATTPGEGLSAAYPGDQGIGTHPSVLFHSDFESGMSGWTSYTQNSSLLAVEQSGSRAHGGSAYLRASITRTQLAQNPYLSAQAQFHLPNRVPEIYWRFYAQYVGKTAVPHHWIRSAATNGTFNPEGQAGKKPGGDQAFWFNLDARNDGSFFFYAYWHEMRSWMCNDGSTDPGCAGYNGPSNNAYYGNNFHPAQQTAFPRDDWFCVEIRGKANTPGQYDGELWFWIDGKLVGEYRTGTPRGRWLRENFFSHGQYYRDEQDFEGFNFRTSAEVGFQRIILDAYYEKGTLDAKESSGIEVPEAQVIWYDDVVLATERVGCKVP
ncbi:MAG: hypothetical protein KF718_29005 [Polyangiaceae bacterium]|nr:hypothetical protein [Polyangiaceae bacterium]